MPNATTEDAGTATHFRHQQLQTRRSQTIPAAKTVASEKCLDAGQAATATPITTAATMAYATAQLLQIQLQHRPGSLYW